MGNRGTEDRPGKTSYPKAAKERGIAGGIYLVTFLAYMTCVRNSFLWWDDASYITTNMSIRHLDLNMLRYAFGFHEANWHPLTWISHAVDYALWGLNPVGHHLVNITLHSVNSALVFLLSVRLIGLYKARSAWLDGTGALVAGAIAGLLFGLHPIHVESVAWAAERKDVLCAFFFLLSLLAYLRYVTLEAGHRNKTYLICLGFFALALMSKPMAVSLPLALLIIDWHPAGRIKSIRSLWAALIEKLPFILLSLGSSALTVVGQKSGGAMQMMERVPLGSRLLVASNSLLSYLWKMVFPVGLLPFYPYPREIPQSYLLSAACVVAVSAAMAFIARRQKTLPAAWAYYAITLLPVLGIVQVGVQSMADRYSYLPSIAPFVLAGLFAAWLWGKAGTPALRAACIAAAALAMLTLGFLTFTQGSLWKDNTTLWEYSLRESPEKSFTLYMNLGVAHMLDGDCDKAIGDYNAAIEFRGDAYNTIKNRGYCYSVTGQLNKAMADFDRMIALDPSKPDAYVDRGMVYYQINAFDNAIKQLDIAINLGPPDSKAYYDRGAAYQAKGAYDKAITDIDEAIALNDSNAEAHKARGDLYSLTGRGGLAVPEYKKACDLGNDDACQTLEGPPKR